MTTPETFKERVEAFWSWFSSVHERFFNEIEAGRCGELQPETSEMTSTLLPGFAWVYGPGDEQKGGHSFTLSGEGVLHLQMLATHWASRAPDLPGWTFYAARQPGKIDGMSIGFGEDGPSFGFEALWITPHLDLENARVDVHLWHPLFDQISESQRNTAMFLMLDEALGEYGVEMWLGTIDISDTQLADSMPLAELPSYIDSVRAEHNWNPLPPGEGYTGYQFEEPPGNFPRGDSFTGTTRNFRLLREYFNEEGEMDDPLAGSGAEFVFVAIDSGILPRGEEIEFRGELEDAIEARLRADRSGETMGGACGTEMSYIDLVIYDGARSLQHIRDVLSERGLPGGTGIHFFAKGNEGRRIFL